MRVRPLVVIPAVGIGFNFDIQSFLILEGSGINQLSLQSVEIPLHRSIVIRTPWLAHTLCDVVILTEFDEFFGCKLAAMISPMPNSG